jgi:hypothetical protein
VGIIWRGTPAVLSREKGAEQAAVDLHTRDRVTSSAVESFSMKLVFS